MKRRPHYSTLYGGSGDEYGLSCDVVGDTNGDGFGDFAVGAWGTDNGLLVDAGAVFLYSGANGSLLRTFLGTGANDSLGFHCSAAGDINGDGFGDICAAAYQDSVPGVGPHCGSVVIYSGPSGNALLTLAGQTGGEWFGFATDSAGDIDGDGHDGVLPASVSDSR